MKSFNKTYNYDSVVCKTRGKKTIIDCIMEGLERLGYKKYLDLSGGSKDYSLIFKSDTNEEFAYMEATYFRGILSIELIFFNIYEENDLVNLELSRIFINGLVNGISVYNEP